MRTVPDPGFGWGNELPTLRGDGVSLRALHASDVEALFEIFGDPEITRYWSRSPLSSLRAAEEFLDEIHAGFEARRLFQWGIELGATGEVVGTCTLFNWDREHLRCELGFALGRKWWGQGIGFHAVSTVLRFAFEALEVHRVEADADPRNERSLRLLERCGFKREGVLRERYFVNGEVQDAVVLGLLRAEWRASGGR